MGLLTHLFAQKHSSTSENVVGASGCPPLTAFRLIPQLRGEIAVRHGATLQVCCSALFFQVDAQQFWAATSLCESIAMQILENGSNDLFFS